MVDQDAPDRRRHGLELYRSKKWGGLMIADLGTNWLPQSGWDWPWSRKRD